MTLYTRKHAIASRQAFDGQIISVRVDTVRTEGKQATREVVEHPGGVVIACTPSRGEIILIRQYRYAVDRDLIELPAGRLESGEPPLSAAKRELAEETGYEAAVWRERGFFYPAVGFSNEKLTWFEASDIRHVGKNLDEDEETEVIQVKLEQAWDWFLSGEIPDAKTAAILAVLMREQAAC